VSLNHYSEPTLHPQLIEYIRSAVTKGLRVRLHTNASLLDDDKLAALAELRDSVYIVVNLPTIVEQEFERVVGAKLYKRVLRNIRALADAGVPLSLSINAPIAARAATVAKINTALGERLGEQVSWPTDDRTGLIQLGMYAEPVTHRGPLAGCLYALRSVNIAFDGSVFLCCQDFDQQYVAGNIRDEPLRAILAGERMAELRGHVFGVTDAPDDFICRRCSWTSSRRPGSELRVGAGRRRARALLTEETTLSDKTAALLESAR
jgi:radical SAM protein with 4Fe4S-binding SPASM domain